MNSIEYIDDERPAMTTGEKMYIMSFLFDLINQGYKLHSVNDGEDVIETLTVKEVIENVAAVEESWIRLTNGNSYSANVVRSVQENPAKITLYVILGNAEDGSEVVADCTDCDPCENATIYAESAIQAYYHTRRYL